MNKLISIEIKKVFKHKSIFVILLIMTIFCILNNIIYKNDYTKTGEYKYKKHENIEQTIAREEKNLKKYNLEQDSDKYMYITTKTKIELAKIKRKYKYSDWRYIKAQDYLYNLLYNINLYKLVDKNQEKLDDNIKKYDEAINNYNDNNWKYFVRKDKIIIKNNISEVNEKIDNTTEKQALNSLQKQKKELENNLLILNYRLDKNITYDDNYLNRALEEYSMQKEAVKKYQKKKLDYEEKLELSNLKQNININKYIIDNKKNLKQENTINYQLRTILDDYELFIVIITILVASITIGEDLNKQTIKLMLIKPYKRSKIILSKYLASLIIILSSILSLVIIQLLIGGMFLGIQSLKQNMVVYDLATSKIIILNIFTYMFIRILFKLPMIIIILNVSFALNILLNSVVAPFSISMLLYTFSEVINTMAINYNVKFMKYFITLNWNFNNYLFGTLPKYQYLNLKNSILIFLIYDIMLLGIIFISFTKKNIKNV